MSEDHAFFTNTPDGLVPTELARSHWSPKFINGPATCGVIARALENDHGAEHLVPSRLTVDLCQPIPAEPLTIATTRIRDGNRIRVADAAVLHNGVVIARATAVFLRPSVQPAGQLWGRSSVPQPPPVDLPALEQAIKVPLFGSDEHPDGWSVAIHEHQGASRKRMWSQQIAAVRGETPSPFVAAAIVGEATSLVTNWGTRGLSFINADLTLVLARQPVGREMGVEADNHVSASGIAVGSAVLFDREGPIGTCTVSAIANEQRTINLGA
ncbi:thioesterase family protein [Rhodococcus sp. JT-3]|uniref:thioesterase family protein n=1 Tax=Rhodococcus sp. JT-3 TaxID=1973213 RepID=UPI001303A09B|nr:thioesterase family protein [Rhodococcus sp. JT-3]